MQIRPVGIDLGYTTFHLVTLDVAGSKSIQRTRASTMPSSCRCNSLLNRRHFKWALVTSDLQGVQAGL